ncbi:MAG: hypothetical protein A3G23_00715 [Bacteroidetes bacterium RIFCSPLOWO2_12_FULL_37_12]|nr:MAG: hypothetical protein A3G23_00715 [Bacteroidetes bacterium RIFCSPLOWO2_12_FULL_37_12]
MSIHIGKIIKQRVEEMGMKKTEFARRVNTTPQNVYDIFNRISIDTELLVQIGKILDFNFFEQYFLSAQTHKAGFSKAEEESAPYLSISEISFELKSRKEKIEKMETEINRLKKENELLAEINSLLKTRQKM